MTASQRKLYLIPVTAGGTPGIMPGATIITSVRSPLRLLHVMRATPESKTYADSGECFSSKMMPRFSTRLIGQRIGKSVQLARREPGDVLKSP